MSKKIAIIHFSPVEHYPPVQNLLNELAKIDDLEVLVYSTRSNLTDFLFTTSNQNISIKRTGVSGPNIRAISRYLTYLRFYLFVTLSLIFYRPKSLLYFETLSSFPALVYKFLAGRFCKLFIHYHEYTSPEEYRTGMLLTRFFHTLEKQIYTKAVWISHTNDYRMEMFLKDIKPIVLKNKHILPNYPSESWHRDPKPQFGSPLKVIYVGAFGLNTMYAREFAQWVLQQEGKVIWDIYAYLYGQEELNYFGSLDTKLIRLRPAIDYPELPEVISNYDVGVILYKGHIPNYIFNVPNKLFEYHTCGLDVWFPDVIQGSMPYVREKGRQKILALDFNNLQSFDFTKVLRSEQDREDTVPKRYLCEDVLKPLIQKMVLD